MQTSQLDYATLARDILRDGGATVSVDDGSVPMTGYCVGQPGHERRISLLTFDADSLRAFVSDNAQALRGHYLGAWIDGDDVVLDVTAVIQNRGAAIIAAEEGRQDAIYSLDYGLTERVAA